MQKLIPVVNKLQEVFSRTKQSFAISLPQIVVVGGQSSGKSSVLENIVGIDFLPRGNNIVTRRPIVIQLNNSAIADRTWAEFAHKPEEKFYDFSKVKEEIEADTERVCGRNKDVSPTPIILKIFSRSVLDLTLVDLPGITKVPTGDQPYDIEARITDMVLRFITPQTAIIMAVSPANQDLATSDAIKLSRKVDPRGERTIGVLTKLDLMDEGTHALDLLQNKVYPLKLGYIGVVCRSQKDINQGKNIQDAIKYEEKFFRVSPIYGPYADKLGVRHLSYTLNVIIINHIKKTLPEIRSQITGFLFQKEKELRGLNFQKEESANTQHIILNAITKYAAAFSDYIDGKFVKETCVELIGGSRINYIFYDVFNKQICLVDPFENMTDDDLKTALKNASSLRPNLFVPEVAFEVLSKQQILRLESPALQCVQMIFEELRRIINDIEIPEFKRFKNLRGEFVSIMYQLLNKNLVPTKQMIENLIKVQEAYINTYHPDFMGGANAVLNVFDLQNYKEQEDKLDRMQESQLQKKSSFNFEDIAQKNQLREDEKKTLKSNYFGGSMGVSTTIVDNERSDDDQERSLDNVAQYSNYEVEKYRQSNVKPLQLPNMPNSLRQEGGAKSPRSSMEIRIIKNLILSYFDIIKKTINDIVPKTIIAFMINKTKNNAQKELVQNIIKEESDLQTLLEEDVEIIERRQRCQEMIQTLKKCIDYLNEVRDFAFKDQDAL